MVVNDLPELQLRPAGRGVPRWMPAFASLMVVLSCFLVLLLSFAETDPRRYRQVADAMADGFDAPRAAPAVPMGTGIIARDFAPQAVLPVPVASPYQPLHAWPTLQRPEPVAAVQSEPEPEPVTAAAADLDALRAEVQTLIAATRDDAATLATLFADEIGRGEVEVEARARTIVIRIRGAGAFAAGTAGLQPAYLQRLRALGQVLAKQGGSLVVGGHTDDAPVANERFRSAWELSAARAAAVAQALLAEGALDPRRLTVSGHAGTRPLLANDSAAHRARNDRVEIVVDQGLDALDAGDRALLDDLLPPADTALQPDGAG